MKGNNTSTIIYRMGAKSSKSCDEKTKTDILLLNTLKDVIERVEQLEETKSDKLVYKLPARNLCSYSLI